MNIILFGPPGAGKGTQATKVVKKFNLHKVSTGDLLREEIKNNTDLGNKIKSIMDTGSLISFDIWWLSKKFGTRKEFGFSNKKI